MKRLFLLPFFTITALQGMHHAIPTEHMQHIISQEWHEMSFPLLIDAINDGADIKRIVFTPTPKEASHTEDLFGEALYTQHFQKSKQHPLHYNNLDDLLYTFLKNYWSLTYRGHSLIRALRKLLPYMNQDQKDINLQHCDLANLPEDHTEQDFLFALELQKILINDGANRKKLSERNEELKRLKNQV